VQTRVRALFDPLFSHKFENAEEFLDDLVQMTSRADIIKECIAEECAEEAATELAELLMK